MRFSQILIVILLALMACKGRLSKEGRLAFKEELEHREVKKVTPGQLTEAVEQQGIAIIDTLYQLFRPEDLQSESFQTSVLTAEDYPLLDSLNKKFNVHIKWIGREVNNDTPVVTDVEAQLLDAYLYNVENSLEVRDNVQRIDEKSFLFTQPMLSGKTGTSTTETSSLAGMWSITLSQKEVILSL